MKYVSTRRGYQSFRHSEGDDGVLTSVPTKVSNDAAEELEKLAAKHGVELLVVDEKDTTEEEVEAARARAVAGRPADLSAGIAAVTGTGAPVTTPTAPASVEGTAPAGTDNTDA